MYSLDGREVHFEDRLSAAPALLGFRPVLGIARSERETLAYAVAELSGRCIGEGDRHQPFHTQSAAGDQDYNARHQLACLAGARAGFDKEGRIELRHQAST